MKGWYCVSIIDSYDRAVEAILQPEHVTKEIEGFPEIVLVAFRKALVDLLIEGYKTEKISRMDVGFSVPIYRFNYKGKNLAMYQSIIGGAGTAGMLEEAISKGGRKFVFFGSCGTLDRNIPPGHLIVPTAAYRDEGTSYHYAPASDYIDVLTAEKLSAILNALNVPHISAKTWTTDGLYRETHRNMRARKEDGCLTVDMECASIMAVGQFRNIEIYQFLYAEDNLDDLVWDPRTMGKVPRSADEMYLKIALEIAEKI